MNCNGKLTFKIVIKDDYIRADGTCALFLQIFLNKKRKRIPCNLSVRPVDFDKKKQRVKSGFTMAKDYNLLIEKMLADINKIEVNYRLGNQVLTMEKLVEEYENPSSRLDFVKFWRNEMKMQKEKLKPGTYRQQISMLGKLEAYSPTLYFYDITDEFLDKIKGYMKNKLRNQDNTVNTFVKSFKKYLNIAKKRGILTPLDPDDIHLRQFRGDRTFLMPDEIRKLHEYWESKFINMAHRVILSKFLFSCFTGLRYSDVCKLEQDNFVDNILVIVAEKTGKLQRIGLNKAALSFVDKVHLLGPYFTNEYINRELKGICKICGISKNVSFHIARHTFATNFLLAGGRVEHLQKLLGHSKIEETMIYVHIVESITDKQIHNMDEILKVS